MFEADNELLAEDRSKLPTHMPDSVQSMPTGGHRRKWSKNSGKRTAEDSQRRVE